MRYWKNCFRILILLYVWISAYTEWPVYSICQLAYTEKKRISILYAIPSNSDGKIILTVNTWYETVLIKNLPYNPCEAKVDNVVLLIDGQKWEDGFAASRRLVLSWYYSDVIMSHKTSQIAGVYILLNRLFRCRSKKTAKLGVTGLWKGKSPVTGEFPAETVSIWWHQHDTNLLLDKKPPYYHCSDKA